MNRPLFSILAASVIAASAHATPAPPSLLGATPEQWTAFTQFAVQEGDYPAMRDSLAQRIHAELGVAAAGNVTRPVPALAVTQWRFLHEVLAGEPDALARVSRGAYGKGFLAWLLGNREAMEEYLSITAVVPVKVTRESGIDGWRAVWCERPDARVTGLWTRVAAACAITFAEPVNGVTAQQRFDFYYESHRDGQLIPYFDKESPFELSLAVYAHGKRNDDLEWAQDVVPKDKKSQVDVSTYGFSLIAYRDQNYRGVSVQTSQYYDQRRVTIPMYMEYGGVCGAVSTINVDVANAHGVPAFTAGQPGHCAYVWKRDEKKWDGGNFISGWDETYNPHTQGFWLDSKAASVNLVSAATDAPGFILGERLRWLASAWRDTNPATAESILAAATKVNPLDYGAWQDRIDAALAWRDAPSQTWLQIAGGVIAAFPQYPMAIDDLLGRFEVEKLLPKYNDKDRTAYAVATARALTGMPPDAQWNLLGCVWQSWLARQLTGFGVTKQAAADAAQGKTADGSRDAWKQVPEAERNGLENFFVTLLPAVESNFTMARGVADAWTALAAQDPQENTRMGAYFQRRLAAAATLRELAIVSEAALAAIRTTPDARANLTLTVRQRVEALPISDPDQADTLADLISRSDFRGSDAIGAWDAAIVSGGGDKTIEWDITQRIAKTSDGLALRLNFRWSAGEALTVKGVHLLEDGADISADTHAQIADSSLHPEAVTLTLHHPKAGARYVVRATVAGGTGSAGVVLCRVEPMAAFDANGWTEIGGWGGKEIHAAPVITVGWHDMEFDIGKYVKQPGPVFVHFQYNSYSCPRIMNVRLYVDGREVAYDIHSCRPMDGANTTYVLQMPAGSGSQHITMKALFTDADGWGTIFVRKQEAATAAANNHIGNPV